MAIGESGAALGVKYEIALKAIDGNPAKYGVTRKPGGPDTAVEVVYELPAETTFDRFAVTDIRETPSPSQTFIKRAEIFGSSAGPADGFELLGSAESSAHEAKG